MISIKNVVSDIVAGASTQATRIARPRTAPAVLATFSLLAGLSLVAFSAFKAYKQEDGDGKEQAKRTNIKILLVGITLIFVSTLPPVRQKS